MSTASTLTNRKFYILSLLVLSFFSIKAQQTNFGFGELSSSTYTEKITQLEKYTVPVKYSEKSAQAWYKEILTDRTKDLLNAFKKNEVLYDTLLLNKCSSILSRIAKANKEYNFDSIKIYINRSMVANAACYGEGTIMVNLGLFLWIDNDDELALVLAHEFAHQLLNHSNGKIEKSIAMLTSEEFKEELKDIKKANNGKFSRFRNLMKGLHIESGKHSTYKESEADSLGIVLIKNAKYDAISAAKVLLKFDQVDDLFTSNKLYVLKNYFENTGISSSYFYVKPKYNGLSSMKVEMNADKDMDSIKTHPDCKKRYESIAGKNNIPIINCCTSIDTSYQVYKERAILEIVRNLYEKNSIGWCTHLALFSLKNNYNPTVYNLFLSMCFSKLYYKDKHIERFNAANTDAARESNLKETQDLLFALSTTELEMLSNYFLNKSTGANAEDNAFATLMYETEVKQKDPIALNDAFLKKYPNSKYKYLIQKKQP